MKSCIHMNQIEAPLDLVPLIQVLLLDRAAQITIRGERSQTLSLAQITSLTAKLVSVAHDIAMQFEPLPPYRKLGT